MHQAVDDPMERQGGVSFSENRREKSPNEQCKRAPGWLGYIGDYTAQLYGDYFRSHYKGP